MCILEEPGDLHAEGGGASPMLGPGGAKRRLIRRFIEGEMYVV